MLSNPNFVPILFWLGFLALGLVTSLGGPAKTSHDEQAVAFETVGQTGAPERTARD